jgi:hypothetical protein
MNIFFRKTGYRVLVAGLFSFTSLTASADVPKHIATTDAVLESLDKRFHQFSGHFYPKLVQFDKYPKIKSIDALVQAIDRYRSQNQPILASAAVVSNQSLVEKNSDNTPIITICSLLVETNEWTTASQLYDKVKAQGDKSLVSNVSFAIAKYYFSRNQWKKTIGIVESIRSDLPPEDYHHALLMHGIALQNLQQHRQALVEYAKIPKTSRYYTAARLNMAVANIRQDWWTDAHIIINDLINDKAHVNASDVTDRLYTVLGYSLLQQQYFRNSRDAFRNVSLDGQYTNKALLGIALTAAYQEDYIGALNAIRILKDKKSHDLPVEEANLLMPYFYEKLQQQTTASAGYAEAIKYYETRTGSIQTSMSFDSELLRKQLVSGSSNTVTINDEMLEMGEKLPKFFFENIRLLAQLQPHVDRIGDVGLLREYTALSSDYKNILRNVAQTILNEKASYLTHYMNQSRYGLARMQDNDAIIPQ